MRLARVAHGSVHGHATEDAYERRNSGKFCVAKDCCLCPCHKHSELIDVQSKAIPTSSHRLDERRASANEGVQHHIPWPRHRGNDFAREEWRESPRIFVQFVRQAAHRSVVVDCSEQRTIYVNIHRFCLTRRWALGCCNAPFFVSHLRSALLICSLSGIPICCFSRFMPTNKSRSSRTAYSCLVCLDTYVYISLYLYIRKQSKVPQRDGVSCYALG